MRRTASLVSTTSAAAWSVIGSFDLIVRGEGSGLMASIQSSTSSTTHSAKTLKEFSEYLGKLAEHEKGGFTPAEVNDIENEMHDVIVSNVKKLGFDVKDIKMLISSHAHFDHVQGHAAMKKVTGGALPAHDAR